MSSAHTINTSRIHHLDALRAFAMLLGVVFHGTFSFMETPYWPVQDVSQYSSLYSYTKELIHGFRMPLFFVISGYFTAMLIDKRGLSVTLRHRVLRIGVPLLIFGPLFYFLIAGIHNWLSPDVWVRLVEDPRPHISQLLDEICMGHWSGVVAHWHSLSAQLVIWHLWFLYYLLILLFLYAGMRLTGLKCSSILVSSRFAWLFWLLVTLLPQFFMLDSFGPDTALGLVPWLPQLLYYIVFFSFGTLQWTHGIHFCFASRAWKWCLLVAVPVGVFGVYMLRHRPENFLTNHIIFTVCCVVYAWLMIVVMLGLFEAILRKENSLVRYVSDSAYWIYVMHFPLVIVIQHLVSQWPITHYIKLPFVVGVTVVILLIVYHFAVRYTALGRLFYPAINKVK